MPIPPEDLADIARRCAAKVDIPAQPDRLPSFSEVEEQCEAEYEQLLEALLEDEVFAPVDLAHQEALVEQITEALPPDRRDIIEELVDNQARHVWLQQEGAYQLGLAVGLRLRQRTGKIH
jgi:hypothetical protein